MTITNLVCNGCGTTFIRTQSRQVNCTPACTTAVRLRRQRSATAAGRLTRRRARRVNAPIMTDAEIGYLAGIIDGEGWLGVAKDNRYGGLGTPRITVGMTDEDVILRLQSMTGVGNIHVRPAGENGNKAFHVWNVTNRDDVARVLLAITPLMSERRKGRIAKLAGLLSEQHQRDMVREVEGRQYVA